MESFWRAVDEATARGDLLPLGILCDALAEAGDPTEAPLRWCYEQRRMPGVFPDGQAWWCPVQNARANQKVRGQEYAAIRRQSSWIPPIYWRELAADHRHYWLSLDHFYSCRYCSVHEAYQDFAVCWLRLEKQLIVPTTGRNTLARTKSNWRNEARRIITVTLRDLPKNATDVERKKAVRSAYPFGERKGHPYVQWLKEQRMALLKIKPFRSQAQPADEPSLFVESVS